MRGFTFCAPLICLQTTDLTEGQNRRASYSLPHFAKCKSPQKTSACCRTAGTRSKRISKSELRKARRPSSFATSLRAAGEICRSAVTPPSPSRPQARSCQVSRPARARHRPFRCQSRASRRARQASARLCKLRGARARNDLRAQAPVRSDLGVLARTDEESHPASAQAQTSRRHHGAGHLRSARPTVGRECQDFCVWGGYSRGSPTRLPFVFEMQYARPDAIAGAKVEGQIGRAHV